MPDKSLSKVFRNGIQKYRLWDLEFSQFFENVAVHSDQSSLGTHAKHIELGVYPLLFADFFFALRFLDLLSMAVLCATIATFLVYAPDMVTFNLILMMKIFIDYRLRLGAVQSKIVSLAFRVWFSIQ